MLRSSISAGKEKERKSVISPTGFVGSEAMSLYLLRFYDRAYVLRITCAAFRLQRLVSRGTKTHACMTLGG